MNYNQIEDKAPSYSLKGRLDIGLFDIKEDYDDPTKLLGFEGSTSIVNQKLPDFNVNKETFPRFIMPKSERFNDTLTSHLNPIHSYNNYEQNYRETLKEIKEKKIETKENFFGTANRFRVGYATDIPGPNQYKIEGFAETRVRFYEKQEKMKEEKKHSQVDNKIIAKANKTGFSGISKIHSNDNDSNIDDNLHKTTTNYFNFNNKQ